MPSRGDGSPGVAVSPVGASGAPVVVVAPSGSEYSPSPIAFFARTR